MTRVEIDIAQVWKDYRAAPTVELRNQLVTNFLPLVKYNAERIWARLPDGVDLDDTDGCNAGGAGAGLCVLGSLLILGFFRPRSGRCDGSGAARRRPNRSLAKR